MSTPYGTTREIAVVAVKLADEEGLEALRRLADRLGKSVMSLYTYVPGKAELLDLMLDTVYAELPTGYPSENGWRAAMEASARAGWDFTSATPGFSKSPA